MKIFYMMQQKVNSLLWKGRFMITGIVASAVGFNAGLVRTYAMSRLPDSDGGNSDAAFDYSFLMDESYSNETIDEITEKTKGIGASGYRLIAVLCAVAFFVCGGFALFRLMTQKSGQKVDETKDWITRILIALALFAALGFIFTAVKGFAGGL